MSSEPETSSSVEEQTKSAEVSPSPFVSEEVPATSTQDERMLVKFAAVHWASTGVARLLYRYWTRVAAHLFAENSAGEKMARSLHIPLPDRLNMSWVNSQLAVGGRILPEDIKSLALLGVTAVVDTRSEYHDDEEALAREHIKFLYLPTPDTYPLTVEQLMQGATWVDERVNEGGHVLIHCEHGVGRSVLLTCAVLVYRGMHANAALTLVKQKRWQAAPNYRQVTRLREFEEAYLSRNKA